MDLRGTTKWGSGEDYVTKNLSLLLTKHFSGNKVKNNDVGGACSTYGTRGEEHVGFWWGNLKARDHLEDLGIDGKIILK